MRAKVCAVGAVFALVAILTGCAVWEGLLPPDAAPAVWATAGELETAIRLSWSPVERAGTYRILRAGPDSDAFEAIADVPGTLYTDEVGRAGMGRWFRYKVQACNDAGCGPVSAEARGYAGYPPAPTDVRAEAMGPAAESILITWDPVPGAAAYDVVRDRVEDGTYPTLIARVTGNRAEDPTATPGIVYWYKVRARNEWGFGPLSEGTSACLPPCVP